MEEEYEEEEWEKQDEEYEGDSDYDEDMALYGQFIEPLFDVSNMPNCGAVMKNISLLPPTDLQSSQKV